MPFLLYTTTNNNNLLVYGALANNNNLLVYGALANDLMRTDKKKLYKFISNIS